LARAGGVKKAAGDSARLDADAWTQSGLQLLADRGIEGVRVELLAKILGVTKGSFYWHFRDRGALLEAMLDDWRRRATLVIIERLERDPEPPLSRLMKLLRLPLAGQRSEQGADVELAIRLWGRHDPKARAALKEVDQLRLRYIAGLLQASGLPPDQVEARAILAYSYMRVAATLIERDRIELMQQCEQLLAPPGGAR
jgi:AcrR family transcriptional regulator